MILSLIYKWSCSNYCMDDSIGKFQVGILYWRSLI
jgi:hypothetical protein